MRAPSDIPHSADAAADFLVGLGRAARDDLRQRAVPFGEYSANLTFFFKTWLAFHFAWR